MNREDTSSLRDDTGSLDPQGDTGLNDADEDIRREEEGYSEDID